MSKVCSVEGCNGKHYAKGYCRKHYEQMRKYGCITDNMPKNPLVIYDDYAEIILYDKHNNEKARIIIDLDDIERCSKIRWALSHNYAVNGNTGVYLHKFIIGASDGVVDHINGDTFDNRKSNLRICSQHQNTMNHCISSANTSGITGVVWDKNKNKWKAQIMVNYKNINLGRFNTKEEAIEARRQAEIDYFGEYRREE